jgi:nucleotide-binding universal stress UspA family protein
MYLVRMAVMSRHILVPVDGSDNSWDAFEYAMEEHAGDTLTVLHVINPMEGDYHTDGPEDEPTKRSKKIERQVRDRIQEAGTDEDGIDYVTQKGRPAEEIVARASDDDIDQVVMGSRGLSGLKRLLLGSVAETVVRRADTPVNIVR